MRNPFRKKEVEPEPTDMEVLKLAIDTINSLGHLLPRKHMIWSDRKNRTYINRIRVVVWEGEEIVTVYETDGVDELNG